MQLHRNKESGFQKNCIAFHHITTAQQVFIIEHLFLWVIMKATLAKRFKIGMRIEKITASYKPTRTHTAETRTLNLAHV
jgi:hypothetical protein